MGDGKTAGLLPLGGPARGWPALACLGFVVTIGCASPSARPPIAVSPRAPASVPAIVVGASRVQAAQSLLGTGYRFGGADRSGFDCSGLTQYVLGYEGIALPRTTEQQAQVGSWVPLDELARGDLVFFSGPSSPPHHVGIVSSEIGEPLKMIHASTSRGVVETRVLDSAYWLSRLRFGRRIVPSG